MHFPTERQKEEAICSGEILSHFQDGDLGLAIIANVGEQSPDAPVHVERASIQGIKSRFIGASPFRQDDGAVKWCTNLSAMGMAGDLKLDARIVELREGIRLMHEQNVARILRRTPQNLDVGAPGPEAVQPGQVNGILPGEDIGLVQQNADAVVFQGLVDRLSAGPVIVIAEDGERAETRIASGKQQGEVIHAGRVAGDKVAGINHQVSL